MAHQLNQSIIQQFDTDQSSINQSDPCPISRTVIESPGYTVFLCSTVFLGVCTTASNFLFFSSVLKVTLFHSNLRLLLAHASFCACWYSVACIEKSITILIALITDEPCRLMTRAYKCRVLEIIISWPSQGLLYTWMSITLERLYCTIRSTKPYEGKPWLAITLIPLCYSVPLINFLKARIDDTGTPLPVCESILALTPTAAKSNVTLNMAMLSIYVILVLILHYWNTRKLHCMLANRAITHTLSARFQLDQNMQLTKIIAPSAILEFVCLIPNQIFTFLIVAHLPLTPAMKILFVQYNHFWKLCFAMAYPVLAFYRNKHLRKALFKIIPRWFKIVLCSKAFADVAPAGPANLDVNVSARVHMDIMQKQWAKTASRNKL